jgi:hypothetical protein
MSFRNRALGLALAALVAAAASAPPAAALEKAALPLSRTLGHEPDAPPDWAASETVVIQYFNLCTGWVWYWAGVPPEAKYGVRTSVPENGRLLRSHFYYAQGAIPGYGYTAIARVLPPFTERCPGLGTLATQPFTPTTGWNTVSWNGGEGVDATGELFVLVTHSPKPGDTSVIVTEKGDPGGARPGGCGTCYQPDRPFRSMQFGQGPAIECPGAPWWDDSGCALELLWRGEVRLSTVSVESRTWGQVKALYR